MADEAVRVHQHLRFGLSRPSQLCGLGRMWLRRVGGAGCLFVLGRQ